jgi:tRNA(fMet)-specific endonuclease VapC
MGIIIDTAVLIDFEKGRIHLNKHISERKEDEFYISVITASELLHGVHRAADPDIREKRSVFVEGVLKNFPVLHIDLAVARVHARLWAELRSRGMMIGLHDSWIAATGIAKGCTLVTSNMREFERIHGLKAETWNKL